MYAQSILCFPKDGDTKVLKEMLDGCYNKLNEAGVSLTGGHSIYDKSVKLGFSVTSVAKSYIENNSVKPGNKIILTKKLGTGVLSSISEKLTKEQLEEFYSSMTTLNKYSYEVIKNYDIDGCTDVTGFGLLGHLYEMLKNTDCSAVVDCKNIQYLNGAKEYAENVSTASAKFNIEYLSDYVHTTNIDKNILELLHDAQTSGGLLFTVKDSIHEEILNELMIKGVNAFVVGVVTDKNNYVIEVI